MTRLRFTIFLITTAFVLGVGYLFSLVARGYRIDPDNLRVRSTGLLVLTSEPNGAEIWINGKLESASNATITLPPDTYDVELKKDAYIPWKKRLTVKKEEVTKYDTLLFPIAPSLSGVTFTGVASPTLSPDGTKLAYAIPAGDTSTAKRIGLWILELTDLPIGFSREPRQITDMNPDAAVWTWSPDSRELLVSAPSGNFVIPAGSTTNQGNLVNVPSKQLEKILLEWETEHTKKVSSVIDKLPVDLRDLLTRKSKSFALSPDEKKVMYTASASAQLKENLVTPIPGSSTQEQRRGVEAGKTYVYDLKEDRNFLVFDKEATLGYKPPAFSPTTKLAESITLKSPRAYWFPTSNHVVIAEDSRVIISDYDGTNAQVVWSGSYVAPYALPMPGANRLLILTSLGGASAPNLYTLGLR